MKIIIKDNDEGISEDNMMRINDPFFTTKPTGKGTGIGLYITSLIINEHNGEFS